MEETVAPPRRTKTVTVFCHSFFSPFFLSVPSHEAAKNRLEELGNTSTEAPQGKGARCKLYDVLCRRENVHVFFFCRVVIAPCCFSFFFFSGFLFFLFDQAAAFFNAFSASLCFSDSSRAFIVKRIACSRGGWRREKSEDVFF